MHLSTETAKNVTFDLHSVTDDLRRFCKVQVKRHGLSLFSSLPSPRLWITWHGDAVLTCSSAKSVTDDLRFVTDDLPRAAK